MAHKRKVSKGGSAEDAERHDLSDEDISELMERIRRLERENKDLQNEKKDLKDRIEDLEVENEVFRKVLETKGILISELQDQILELRRRVNMDSSNSSKPPSTDGFKRPKARSLRRRSGSRPGGQPGHMGHHMRVPHEPDSVVLYHPSECEGCPNRDSCSESMFSPKESRYVVDIELRAKVTEHRILSVNGCPMCDGVITGSFPENVSAHVQYGDSVATVVSLLNTYGAMSDSRISTVMCNLFDITISPGTIVSMVSKCAEKVGATLETIKERIIGSEVSHFDETGSRVEGGTQWVHDSSTDTYTYLTLSKKRGQEGMDENGVLPKFNGVAIHDCWRSYWKYDVPHGICNAHILRELNGIVDNRPDHIWPRLFRALLRDMKSDRDDAVENGLDRLPQYLLECYDDRFERIMGVAEHECPPPPEPEVRRRGRRKVGKERSLIERITVNKDSIFRFVHDLRVPFDNNLAERDIRNVKTKTKVSGCFRSTQGAKDYLGIMSFLSTAKKHGIDVVKALMAAFRGEPQIVLTYPSE